MDFAPLLPLLCSYSAGVALLKSLRLLNSLNSASRQKKEGEKKKLNTGDKQNNVNSIFLFPFCLFAATFDLATIDVWMHLIFQCHCLACQAVAVCIYYIPHMCFSLDFLILFFFPIKGHLGSHEMLWLIQQSDHQWALDSPLCFFKLLKDDASHGHLLGLAPSTGASNNNVRTCPGARLS